jgi:molybdenum cofactor cytidylyltransferase
LSADDIATLAGLEGVDAVLVEADGSRARPFKAPGDHEPVIPSGATHVVAVVGASVVGRPLDDPSVHRPERVRALVPGLAREAVCDATTIALVLMHDDGGRKGVAGRPFTVVVNQADTHPEAAQAIAEGLRSMGLGRMVVTALRDVERPVRE